jgi:hypothetical protein
MRGCKLAPLRTVAPARFCTELFKTAFQALAQRTGDVLDLSAPSGDKVQIRGKLQNARNKARFSRLGSAGSK